MAKRKWIEFNVMVIPSVEEEGSKVVEYESSPETSKEILAEEPRSDVESTTEVETVEEATATVTETAGEEESTAEAFWSLLVRAGCTAGINGYKGETTSIRRGVFVHTVALYL